MESSSFLKSRRMFLLQGGLGLGGLSFVPRCFAAKEDKKLAKVSLAIVSDTHLGYQDKDQAARQWELTASEIGKSSAELVLHLGDVVDGGREAQYPIYLKTRENIGKPVHEIPGNHDPAPLFEKHIRKPVDTVIEHKWLRFLLLNNSRTDSHDGFLSSGQLDWIEKQCLDAAKDRKYIALCMHVPAHANRHPDRGWHIKPDHGQKELYKILARHQSRVLCLMHGHFHNGLRGWEDHAPVHEIVFPSALYNRDRHLEAQKAPGYNLPEFRPGYTRVTIDGGKLRLEYQPVGVAEFRERIVRLDPLDPASTEK